LFQHRKIVLLTFYFSLSASTKMDAGRRIRELRGERPLPLLFIPALRNKPLPPKRRGNGSISVCISDSVSGDDSEPCCNISMPRRNVIISRIKQATAEAAEPLSLEDS